MRPFSLNPDEATGLKADLAQAYKKRAWSKFASKQYDLAADDLRQAILLDPTTSNKLIPYLQEAQAGNPGPYSAIASGDQHTDDGAYDLAVEDYTRAIQATPSLAEAYLGRGFAYRQLNRPADARADFDAAVKLDPNSWLGFYERGKFYQFIDQFDQAVADFDKASAVIDAVHDDGYVREKKTIDDARKSLQFNSTLEGRWISYLKAIQVANNYPNWSGAPYNLYAARHNLQNSCSERQPYQFQPGQVCAVVMGTTRHPGARFGYLLFLPPRADTSFGSCFGFAYAVTFVLELAAIRRFGRLGSIGI